MVEIGGEAPAELVLSKNATSEEMGRRDVGGVIPGKEPNGVSAPTNPYRDSAGKLIVPQRLLDRIGKDLRPYADEFKEVVDNSALADKRYNEIPDSLEGKVIGTDVARELLPEYAANFEGRMKLVPATNDIANIYAKDRLWREVNSREDRKSLLFLAGGVAVGKSSTISAETVKEADLVFDGTLRDTEWAIQTINRAIGAGWDVSLVYVQRDLEHAAWGAINRAQDTGRWLPMISMPENHQSAQDSMIRIIKTFSEKSSFTYKIFLNRGTPNNIKNPIDLSLGDIDIGGAYSYHNFYGKQWLDKGEAGANARSDAPSFIAWGRSAVERIFREAVESGKYHPEILRRLAQGSYELERIVARSFQRDAAEGAANPSISGNLEGAVDPKSGAEEPGWKWPRIKGEFKARRQMEQRGWQIDEIDEAMRSGKRYPAINNVNKENSATRYVHPGTGRSVVVDDKSKEILHFGGDGFKYD